MREKSHVIIHGPGNLKVVINHGEKNCIMTAKFEPLTSRSDELDHRASVSCFMPECFQLNQNLFIQCYQFILVFTVMLKTQNTSIYGKAKMLRKIKDKINFTRYAV